MNAPASLTIARLKRYLAQKLGPEGGNELERNALSVAFFCLELDRVNERLAKLEAMLAKREDDGR